MKASNIHKMATLCSQSRLYKSFLVFLLLQISCSFLLAQDQQESITTDMSSPSPPLTVVVVGATGATGKHVVQQLLDHPNKPIVKVVARSSQLMLDLLSKTASDDSYGNRLDITQASLLDLSAADLQTLTTDADAVISCLGHNMDFKGIFGQPRQLVTEAVTKLTTAMSANGKTKTKFCLMNSDGVTSPAGTDDRRTLFERSLINVLRFLVPPHADNEAAAAYFFNVGTNSSVEWSVVRPTDLVDGEATEYTFHPKPIGSLFGSGIATRANVAKAMVDLVTDETVWEKYKFQFPVLCDAETEKEGKGEL